MAVCFHNPDEDNAQLSNWYPAVFDIEGRRFTSVEQYFMWKKATVFGDREAAAEILATKDCAAIKAIGRRVRGFDGARWSEMRVGVMKAGLLAKFRQNPELKAMLLATENERLVECSEDDLVWGNGLAMTDPCRADESRMRGANLMGRTLTAVRELIREEEKRPDGAG